jgi:hypothetical protein
MKVPLCLIKHHAMRGGGIAPPLLTSALGGGEWSDSHPCRFTPEEKPPVPSGLEAGWSSEPVRTLWMIVTYVAPVGESNPGRPPRRCTDWVIPGAVEQLKQGMRQWA